MRFMMLVKSAENSGLRPRNLGTAAMQLGSLVGLKAFGTASKPKRDLVAALGGIPRDYRTEDVGQRAAGVDAVFDPTGGP